jgi:hypothetical protein
MVTEKYGTSVITDIRNFTGIFEQFQNDNSEEFINFLENYYMAQSLFANIVSDDVHLSSTGDGVLTIFLSENSQREGFAFLLLIHRYLTNMCETFTKRNGIETSFGIGADSGSVWDVGKNMEIKLDTYVGNVINRSSRIEGNTKNFGNTTAAIGNFLYKNLIKDLYPKAFDIMEKSKNYDSLLNKHPDIVLLSKELMLFYIFEMELKNMDKPLPIFRLSEYMVSDDEIYWRVISKLLSEEKVEKLKKEL